MEFSVLGLTEAGMKRTHDPAVYITVSELADELGVHRNTIHYWIREGRLTARRFGLAKKSPLLITREEARRVREELARPVGLTWT
jgi:excisionase family DNA binding protein